MHFRVILICWRRFEFFECPLVITTTPVGIISRTWLTRYKSVVNQPGRVWRWPATYGCYLNWTRLADLSRRRSAHGLSAGHLSSSNSFGFQLSLLACDSPSYVQLNPCLSAADKLLPPTNDHSTCWHFAVKHLFVPFDVSSAHVFINETQITSDEI